MFVYFCFFEIPPDCGLLHWGGVFDKNMSLPFFPIHLGWDGPFILVAEWCSASSQVLFRGNCFICSYILLCPWEELSSGSSSATILSYFPENTHLEVILEDTLRSMHTSKGLKVLNGGKEMIIVQTGLSPGFATSYHPFSLVQWITDGHGYF